MKTISIQIPQQALGDVSEEEIMLIGVTVLDVIDVVTGHLSSLGLSDLKLTRECALKILQEVRTSFNKKTGMTPEVILNSFKTLLDRGLIYLS